MGGRGPSATQRPHSALGEQGETGYRLLFEANPLPAWVCDTETLAFLEVNAAAIHHYGYSREEFLAMTIKDIRPPEEIPRLLACVANIAAGLNDTGLWLHRKKDGTLIQANIRVAPIVWLGRPALLILAVDVTEQNRAERALQESERTFHTLAETSDVAFFIFQGTKMRYVNSALEALAGYKREELLKMDFWSIVHPDFRELVRERGLARQRGEPVPSRYQVKIVTKNGCERWLEIAAGRIEYEGKPAGLGTAFDITAHKRAEQALRESQERYRELLENANDAIYTTDLAGNFLTANKKAEQITGYTRREALGMNIAQIVAPECLELAHRMMELKLAQEVTTTFELEIVAKDGRRVPVEVSSRLIYRDGRPVGTQGIARDITERKRVEEQLKLYGQIFAHTVEAISVLDPQGRIREQNAAHRSLFGYADEELLGQTCALLMGEGTFSRIFEVLSRTGSHQEEVLCRTRAGTELSVDLSLVTIRNDKGEVLCHVALKRDITARRQLEAQLRQAQKMEAIGRLAGGVAHDFSNLLAGIVGYNELLLNAMDAGDSRRRYAQQALKACEQGAHLTQQLLAFGRKQMLEPTVLNLNVVVAGMGELLQRLIGEDIELVTQLSPESRPVKADAMQMEQALLNLAANARDAMPQGGRLTIATANVELDNMSMNWPFEVLPGPYVMLAVSDTGQGMDLETVGHIFEPFFTTKRSGRGTGLGLATVYGIVKQSGGYISVDSQPGRGTSFKIYLPQSEVPENFAAPKQLREVAAAGTETILLVEDEESVRRPIQELLAGRGYRVLAATNGVKAIKLAKRYHGPIHLLLTDVVMPGMTGRELAEKLVSCRPALKVLYMSGYPHEFMKRRGVPGRSVSFLPKPFSGDSLAKKIRRTLDESM